MEDDCDMLKEMDFIVQLLYVYLIKLSNLFCFKDKSPYGHEKWLFDQNPKSNKQFSVPHFLDDILVYFTLCSEVHI